MCKDNCFNRHTMPHREVIKESSLSSKTRVVFDVSSKQTSNYSLNESLISGGNLNVDLVDVILKFRDHKIGFVVIL